MMMMMMMMIVNELKSRCQGRNFTVSRKSDLINAARDDHLLCLTASPHDGQFRILGSRGVFTAVDALPRELQKWFSWK
jgi:hypothetical protein